MDFEGSWEKFLPLAEIAYNNIYQSSIQMTPYEALYGRQCHSPVYWFEPGEAKLLGTNLVRDSLEKVKLIQDRLRTAQSRQKSYSDQKVHDVTSMVGERVLLRVSPMKGVIRFGKKGKLSPRYIRTFENLDWICEVAYKFALPPRLYVVHPVFHVSMLRRYYGDPSHVLDFSTVQLVEDLTYIEELVAILDIQVLKLRSKNIALVKIQWKGHPIEEVTRETEHNKRSRYSNLFITSGMSLCTFEDKCLF
ncbi:uncharacterized protein [Nicotiana tomentosiformis]|uniref:uncharacterized protein n=1 Tax=Nicotiana tomentosiformis TaxID=4098 RepID=UPI00388C94DA